MKRKKIFKKIVVSMLTLAIMCSNIPVSAGSLPDEELKTVTVEAPAPEEPEEETSSEIENPAGSEQSGPSVPENGIKNDASTPEPPADPVQAPVTDETPGTEQPPEIDETPDTEQLPVTDETPDTKQPPEVDETPDTEQPPEADGTLDPEEQPAEPDPEVEFVEEEPMDYENQTPIEEASTLPDAEGTVATIWKARAVRSMLFSLYNLDPPTDEEIEKKAWTFDAYYVNQQDPYNVTKTSNFDLKYQMEFHASQDLAKGAVLIRIDADLYTDRDGNVVLPTEIAVPEGTLNDPVPNRTTPFNYYTVDEDEDGTPDYLVFFNYKKIPSGTNAAWQVLYKNQKLMNIVDETPWTLTPQISVDTGAQVPTENEPDPEPARSYEDAVFEDCTALTGKVNSSVNLTSVVKTPYNEPGKNYTPGLYTATQISRYINGTVPDRYLGLDGRLDTANWRFAVWDVKIQGTATQPWLLSVQDMPSISGSADTEGMEIVGYKNNSDPTTSYRLAVNAPRVGWYSPSFDDPVDFYSFEQREESWGNRFYVVTAYPADRVTAGTVVENTIRVTLMPGDGIDSPVEMDSTPATWIYADYDWDYRGVKIGIDKQNGTGATEDKTVYTGWLDAYRQSSAQGKPYGEIPYSTTSVMHGYSDTHRTRNGEDENGVSYTTGDYIPGTYYTFTTADDFLYLHTDEGKIIEPLTGADYYFSDVRITQIDRGYDIWEDETKNTELWEIDSEQLPSVFLDEHGGVVSPVRIYAMLADPVGPESDHPKDEEGWELIYTGEMEYYGQFSVDLNDVVPDIMAQHPYRIKVVHDSVDFESSCRIDVNVCLKNLSDDAAIKKTQKMSKVLEDRGETTRNDAKSPVIELENLSSAMCRAYQENEDGESKQTAFYSFGPEDLGAGSKNYQEPDLKEYTQGLYPGWSDDYLPIRDSATRSLTWLNEVAQANKESKATNDVTNSRVLVDYYLTAYDGYEIYDRDCLNYLKEKDKTLISPGRSHVVFYDLLPYGMQYDASTAPTAGRITELDTQGHYKNRPDNWSKTQVQVVVDPDRDIVTDYRGTGRTMVAFHVIFTGADATSYTAQKWIEGWGVSFRAYYDWKDISQINNVDINSNLCAFMPDFGEASGMSNNHHPSLCGLKTEVEFDNGKIVNTAAAEAYADMVTGGGNIDGIEKIQITDENGNPVLNADGSLKEEYIDEKYLNVLYARNSLSDNVATASSSKIETLVHADADLLGPFGPIATVPVSENASPGSKMNLYTYDNTVTVESNTTDVVIFNRLETSVTDRTEDDPFKPFEENPWSGTFRGIDTNGLDKQGIAYTVYYNAASDAPVTTGNEDPKEILKEDKGWFTEEAFINRLPEKDKENWKQHVKAVAVDLGKTEVPANESVSFRIQMTAPAALEEGQSIYTYNNARFSSKSVEDSIRSTVIGNSVRVAVGKPQTLEVIKRTSGAVPSALADERFEFHIYETYVYDKEETRQDLAYTRYRLYRWNKQSGKWEEQRDQAYATDGNGRLYLRADERAVFDVVDAGRLTVQETENVFWEQQISDRTTKSVDGRQIGASDGDRRIYTMTNVYRPVLYAQKSISSVPEGVNLTEADRTFTFRIRTKGNDGQYHALAEAEYWVVDSARLDGGIPTKLKAGKTDENGEFTIKTGEIIALFPGIAGTQYELSEVIPDGDTWNWHCENPLLTGKLPSGGDSRTITNYYRWKDLLLKKEITHQTKEEYDAKGQAFTFRLIEADLDAQGNPKVDGDGEPIAKVDQNGKLTTEGLEWVLLNEDGEEPSDDPAAGPEEEPVGDPAEDTGEEPSGDSTENPEEEDPGVPTEPAELPTSGTLSADGTFTCRAGYRTVKVKGLEAGKIYILQELTEGIDTDGTSGRPLYVPNNDTLEVTMPIYSTKKDVTMTNDYQMRPLTVTKTIASADGDGSSDDNTFYDFRVTIQRLMPDGTFQSVPVTEGIYTATRPGAVSRDVELTWDEELGCGTFSLLGGETVVFENFGMLGDKFEVEEVNKDLQIYPPKRESFPGTLSGDGGEASFVNGKPGSLLISKEYTGLDDKGRELAAKWKEQAKGTYNGEKYGELPPNDVGFILNVMVNGKPYTEGIEAHFVNQMNPEESYEDEIWPGVEMPLNPWYTVVLSVGNEMGMIPADAVYTLEEVEESRHKIQPWTCREIDETTGETVAEEQYWMQIDESTASESLLLAKSVSERPAATIYNEVRTLPEFKGSQIGKWMTTASDEVPAGAKLMWRVEKYDAQSKEWSPAEGIPYVVCTRWGDPVSAQIETTKADGKIPLVKIAEVFPMVWFQTDIVYVNLYDVTKVSEPSEGKSLLRLVEVPEESDSAWGMLAGYVSRPENTGGSSGPRKAKSRANIQDNLNSMDQSAPPYSMSTVPANAIGFMNSNVSTSLEIEKQMTAASETKFTMILRQVLSTMGEVTKDNYLTAITADRPAAGIPYTIYGTEKTCVTGPGGEIELKAGERAVLHVPDGTMWTVSEQTSLTPNYRLASLDPENGEGSDKLTKLSQNLMLINLPASEKYTLIFDDNGGSGGPGMLAQTFKEAPQQVTFTIPAAEPQKLGYKFLGWSKSREADTADYQPGGSISLGGDTRSMKLYAVWKEGYTITYIDSDFPDKTESQFAASGEKINILNAWGNGSQWGWEFQGWTNTQGAGKVIYKEGDPCTPTSNMTLWAVWRKITVTYTDGVDGKNVFADQGTEGLKAGDTTPAFNGTPTREGYKFMGWSPAVRAKISADDAENGEIVYTATWEQLYRVRVEKYDSKGVCLQSLSTSTYCVLGETINLNPSWKSHTIDGVSYSFVPSEVKVGGETKATLDPAATSLKVTEEMLDKTNKTITLIYREPSPAASSTSQPESE